MCDGERGVRNTLPLTCAALLLRLTYDMGKRLIEPSNYTYHKPLGLGGDNIWEEPGSLSGVSN